MSRAEQLAKIPEGISREAYTLLVSTVLPGIDLDDLIALRLGARSITAEVLAKDANGHRIVEGDEVATHEIVIPVVDGVDPQVLLDVANAYIEKWARLVEEQEAGAQLDGRSSIYTGETYAEARDRWTAYRDLLLDELRAPDGGLH